MIVLIQAFKEIKSKNQYNNNNINNLRDRIHSNACRLAYSRQQYEAGITKRLFCHSVADAPPNLVTVNVQLMVAM